LDAYAEKLIKRRDQARKQGQWQQADDLRAGLVDYGVLVFDGPAGTVWERIPKEDRP
jgi:cysteinyl-tRNA synthetase